MPQETTFGDSFKHRLGSSQPGVVGMLAMSMALHAVLAGGVVALVVYAPHFVAPPQQVLMTKLVRLGKPRPKEMLPRLPDPVATPAAPDPAAITPPTPPPVIQAPAAAPPAANVPSAAVAVPLLVPKSKPSVAAKPAQPSARDRVKALSRVHQALERLKGDVVGEKDGAVEGDSDVSVEGNAYLSEVERCIRGHYAIEGYTAEKLQALQAQTTQADVVIFIDSGGKITRFNIKKSSGPSAFDQAVSRAVTRCGKVSPPPAAMRALVRAGVEIVFKP